ncbi:hypothetical protein [Hydrogenimonas thermophila]|uniref:N-acetylglutamate synthase n=1 Tax=Hydrogenimonas thermophila TaxID=223786 RepID=A0A1I5V0N3_9BACT|nr:hypothetical protein [Hydrogenimonas thermophila]WOE68850.1 hypothetical protein RZR91_06975 [Hydrogenimonas thermophila]WOE71358.1 hypothetical protein RZR97_06945 [Hydrogenimonas thermophila]SFQ01094.1 hypothetical protein SAMN05216234_1802 [Hydrogenimonas thermophila]
MINLDKKTFKALSNSENGEVNNDTVFYYSQKENIISADYNGGEIIKGNLIGKQLENGEFDFVYHHINKDGQLKIGKCLSTAILQKNGKIKLFERWQWLSDDMSSGTSELIEID